MNTAYIIDSSYDRDTQFNELENVYVVPFSKVEHNGTFNHVYNPKEVAQLTSKENEVKSYIEPTHGQYRDLIRQLQVKFDNIIVIPQSKHISKSYVFANYAKNIISNNDNIEIIDINEISTNSSLSMIL